MALHPICPVILYSELTLNRPLRRPELIPATSSPPFRGSFVQLRSLPGTRLGRSLGSYNRAKYVDKNRETRPIKGKLDETSKVSLRFPFFAWIQGELREREVVRRRMEGRKVIGRDVEPWSWIGNRERKLVWKGWSRREWVRGREDRDIRRGDGNFSKRFPVPVCTSGRFLSSGWIKSRGKLRFKLGKGVGKGISNDCCSVVCFRRLTALLNSTRNRGN